jgi:Na+/glutamate symporter
LFCWYIRIIYDRSVPELKPTLKCMRNIMFSEVVLRYVLSLNNVSYSFFSGKYDSVAVVSTELFLAILFFSVKVSSLTLTAMQYCYCIDSFKLHLQFIFETETIRL